jgi:hypothetical protein
MARTVVALLAVCALCAQVALARDLASANTDRTLNTAGQTCKDRFTQIQTQLYANDATCADLVKKAMTSNDAASCPDGLGGSKVGSKVQQCMSKSAVGPSPEHTLSQPRSGPNLENAALHPQDTQAAWIAFIKGCEVFNVSNVSPRHVPGCPGVTATCWCLFQQEHSLVPAVSTWQTEHVSMYHVVALWPQSYSMSTDRMLEATPANDQRPCCCCLLLLQRGGEAEASADAKPSCLPRFGSVQEFQSWISGSSKSSSSSVRLAWGAAVAAAAAAAVL